MILGDTKESGQTVALTVDSPERPKKTKRERCASPNCIMASPQTIAKMFDSSEGTLANLRSKKKGPPFYRVGKKILYDVEETKRWFKRGIVRTIDSLAEAK